MQKPYFVENGKAVSVKWPLTSIKKGKTVLKDPYVYMTAETIIAEHGGAAIIQAMIRIEECRAESDENGMALWRKIADAVEWIQDTNIIVHETCH